MTIKMKKIYLLLTAVILCAVSSCHKPEWVEPTAERQGITSLTAYFTFNKLKSRAWVAGLQLT